ncbi:MAG: hypothetical protein OIN84_10500 [Candidatus Methanoperedens sp.]|uniref:hypothetical protein n=1 Tax=Candidatus Methanoperedens sp. BLZ2 TaxID=2035255 RepID=UPI000BE48509|nr:hypothetical protein [Candidatus Methanoperedens sp. BLZ2]KAB2943751.1 MAG: hypothetical protein F9K14_15645 [Candidatus Methanoperedens sp.]MBZ0174696.1 hypothetical protein [Candidatus Methanoperedens nitroreducens]MCX9078392.1 hypothetical protein [Candidatus Methanoperedens sp.]
MNMRLWVFRLSLGNSGEPSNECPVDLDRDDIKRYRHETSPIKFSDYPDLDLAILNNELFEKGKLRQGWGTSFNRINLDLNHPQKKWLENYIKLAWKVQGEKVDCEDAMGRYNILKGMKDMKVGNIVFVPRIPDENQFTVATVKKEYYFQKITGFIGHGHVIEIKKIKIFNYYDFIVPKIFNPYRRAIGEIKENHQNFRTINTFIKKYYSFKK